MSAALAGRLTGPSPVGVHVTPTEEEQMEQIHERVAGLDVHRNSVAACLGARAAPGDPLPRSSGSPP